MDSRDRKNSRGVCVAGVVLSLAAFGAHADPPFDRGAWEGDFRALKAEIERSYSHLAWFGTPEGGVDLPALDRATSAALQRAQTDAEASAALVAFVAGFRDRHLARTPVPAKAASDVVEPPVAELASDAKTACASVGYLSMSRIPFSLPFETLPRFTLLADGTADPFRAGVLEVGKVPVGVVRIARFRATEYPALCERVWAALRARHVEPNRKAIAGEVEAEWLRTLAARLRELKARRVAATVVDLGDNGGGTDLGDWAVRLFTAAPVRSAPMWMVAGPVSVPYFDVQLADLRAALAAHADLPAFTRSAVLQGIAAFEQRKRAALSTACDLSWVWHTRRPWRAVPCNRLVDGGFASGHLDYAAPGSLDRRAAPALYWASAADDVRGAWDGPTYVLTDGWTASAAEAFTALMRDRGIAKTIGARTMGLGCGFADNDTPFVLPHARLAFRMPNCVRLRADGTDDVAGIVPDLPLVARPGESPRGLAARALQMVVADSAR